MAYLFYNIKMYLITSVFEFNKVSHKMYWDYEQDPRFIKTLMDSDVPPPAMNVDESQREWNENRHESVNHGYKRRSDAYEHEHEYKRARRDAHDETRDMHSMRNYSRYSSGRQSSPDRHQPSIDNRRGDRSTSPVRNRQYDMPVEAARDDHDLLYEPRKRPSERDKSDRDPHERDRIPRERSDSKGARRRQSQRLVTNSHFESGNYYKPAENNAETLYQDENCPSIDQKVEWISKKGVFLIRDDDLKIKDGLLKYEPKFCDLKLVERLNLLKKSSSSASPRDLDDAMCRANPFYKLHDCVFYLPKTIEIANIDKYLNSQENRTVVQFVDMGCSGVVEYLFWRLNRQNVNLRGFGFGDRQNEDYFFDEIMNEIRGRFTINYGLDHTGNMFDEDNIRSFVDLVVTRTERMRVDLVFGLRSYSPRPFFDQIDDQQLLHSEHFHRQTMLCEILIAFQVLREGGHFVLKTFGTLDSFSVELIYILYSAFDEISMIRARTVDPVENIRLVSLLMRLMLALCFVNASREQHMLY